MTEVHAATSRKPNEGRPPRLQIKVLGAFSQHDAAVGSLRGLQSLSVRAEGQTPPDEGWPGMNGIEYTFLLKLEENDPLGEGEALHVFLAEEAKFHHVFHASVLAEAAKCMGKGGKISSYMFV